MLKTVLIVLSVGFVLADDPIVHLSGRCPGISSNNPSLHLTADVPAYALARCRNGDKQLTETDEVNFLLGGSFDQSYSGDRCQFFKKDGSNTYTVDVEVGWGETNSKIVQQRRIHTVSCAYDAHGRAISETETIGDWFLNPWEAQTLLGANSTASFLLQVVDVLDREIDTDYISIGRKIRLIAQDTTEGSGELQGFRALSCTVQDSTARYYILRAGCGDGLVFPKVSGFETVGDRVISPYFDAFKLSGDDDSVTFQCLFTECDGPCDGDSCSVFTERTKRSIFTGPTTRITATSRSFKFRPGR